MTLATQIHAVPATPGECLEPAGSFAEFERCFGLTDSPEEEGLILWDELPAGFDPNLVWTVATSFSGDKEYLVPGLQRPNRVGYVEAERPRADDADQYRIYSLED